MKLYCQYPLCGKPIPEEKIKKSKYFTPKYCTSACSCRHRTGVKNPVRVYIKTGQSIS